MQLIFIIQPNQDISLKALVLQLGEYLSHLFSSWKLITLAGFLTAFVFLGLNFKITPLYQAELSFMLNDDNNSSLGSVGNILGQFGLGMGSSESNIDRIIELSRARIINQSALFSRDQEHFLANRLIESLEAQKRWSRKGLFSFGSKDGLDLKDFRFTHDSITNFSLLENKALKKLYAYLVGKEKTGSAFRSDYSELSGIMNFKVTTGNQDLSIDLVNQLFDELNYFYQEKSEEKQRNDYQLIKSKYDSINSELKTVQYSLAKFEDQHRDLFRKQDLLREKQLKGDEFKLSSMVAEAEKQLQIAQLSLENKSAYIQLIDRPLAPLRPINKGRIYYFLLGGLLGGLFSIAWVILSKMYKDLMAS